MIDPIFEQLAVLLTLSTPFIILVLCYVCYLRTTSVKTRRLNASVWGYIYSNKQWLAQLRLNILYNVEGKRIRIRRLTCSDEFYYLDHWVYNRLCMLTGVERRNLFSRLLILHDLMDVVLMDGNEFKERDGIYPDNFKEYLK